MVGGGRDNVGTQKSRVKTENPQVHPERRGGSDPSPQASPPPGADRSRLSSQGGTEPSRKLCLRRPSLCILLLY